MEKELVVAVEKSLRRISYLVKQHGRKILAEHPITPPQFAALQWLHENGDMTIGELSNKMYLACSTTTDLVDRLEKNGLVERKKDHKDRRVVTIHLLEKGRKVIQEVIEERQQYLEEILGHFSYEKLNTLNKSLQLLRDEMTAQEKK